MSRTKDALLILLSVVTLVAGCVPSEVTPAPPILASTEGSQPTAVPIPSEAPKATPTPIPTETPVSIPVSTGTPVVFPTLNFADVDFEPLLRQPGDYLKDTKLLRFRDAPPTWYRSLPVAERVVHVDWETYHPGSPGGGLTIFLYGSPEAAGAAWSAAVDLLKLGGDTYELSGIGEQAIGQEPSALAFVRCHAVVLMNLGHGNPEMLSPYAKFIDKGLQPMVCR